jgi:hypothetical protein
MTRNSKRPDISRLKTEADVLAALEQHFGKAIDDDVLSVLRGRGFIDYVLMPVPDAWDDLVKAAEGIFRAVGEDETEDDADIADDDDMGDAGDAGDDIRGKGTPPAWRSASSRRSRRAGDADDGIRGKGTPPRTKSEKREVVPLMTELERRYVEVLSAFVAKKASKTDAVVDFRKEILDGAILTPEEAASLLLSEPAAFLSRAKFKDLRIPVVGHRLRGRRGRTHARVIKRKWRIEWREGSEGWKSREVPYSCDEDRRLGPHSWGIERLSFPPQEGMTDLLVTEVTVYPGAVLDELRVRAEELAKRYDWDEAAATWFILTDATPVILPIQSGMRSTWGGIRDNWWINLSFQPWLSFKTVTQVVKDAQRAILGKRSYPITKASLELFRFLVIEHGIDEEASKPDWTKWMKAWNREYPEHPRWHWNNARNFGRHVLAIYDALLHPKYVWPQSETRQDPPRVAVPYPPLENDTDGESEQDEGPAGASSGW